MIKHRGENTMTTISENQDAAPSPETTYRMSVGDTFKGSLSTYEDIDWIGIELSRGDGGDNQPVISGH